MNKIEYKNYLLKLFFSFFIIFSIINTVQAKALEFDIPAQSTEKSLLKIADIAGVQIFFSNKLVKDKQSEAFRSKASLNEALDELLKDTGLTYVFKNKKNMVIIKEIKVSLNEENFDSQSGEESEVEEDAEENKITIVGERVVRRHRTESIEPTLVYDVEFFQQFEPASIQDMLKRIPGIFFATLIKGVIDPQDNSEALSFRGIEGRGGQVLINGRRLPGINGTNTIDFSSIPAELVQEVRVIRSPTADIDSQGTGLTINVILKDGTNMPKDSSSSWRLSGTSTDGDSGGELGLNHYGFLSEQTQYSVNIAASSRPSNSDFTSTSTDITPFGTSSETLINQSVVDEESFSLNTSLNTLFDNDSSLDLTAYFIDTDLESRSLGFDPITNVLDSDSTGNRKTETSSIGGLYTLPFGSAHEATIDLSYARTEFEAIFGSDLFFPGPDNSTKQKREEIKLNVKLDLELSETQALKFGSTLEETEQERIRDFSQARSFKRNREEDGLDFFVVYLINLTETIDLQIGNRYETTDYNILGDVNDELFVLGNPIDPFVSLNDSGNFKVDNSGNNPSVNLRWKLSGGHQLRFSYAKTVNLPTASQISPLTEYLPSFAPPFGVTAVRGNPNLDIEKSNGVDISYEYAFGDNGILGISIYSKKVKDQIFDILLQGRAAVLAADAIPNLAQVETALGAQVDNLRTFVNTDNEEKINGIEIDFSTPLSLIGLPKTVNLLSNLSYFKRDSGIPDSDTDQISGNLTLDHLIESWGLSYGFSYNFSSDDNRTLLANGILQNIKLERDASLDMFLQKRFSNTLLVRLNMENLLDTKDVGSANSTFDTPYGPFMSSSVNTSESEPIFSLTVRGSF